MVFSYTPEESLRREERKKARTARLEQKKRLIQELQEQLSINSTPPTWSLAHFQFLVKGASSYLWGSREWAFCVLGLKLSSSEKEAKSTYVQWLKSLHPDRSQLLNLPPQETQEATAILNEAWTVIKKFYYK